MSSRGGPRDWRPLDSRIHVRLSEAEHADLREALFEEGGLSFQSFFRRQALQKIKAYRAIRARQSSSPVGAG